jgi:hypothetical protein
LILLTATTDKISVITGQAVTTDVHVSYMDASNAVPPVVQGDTMGRKNTAITTATTTDISGSPASSEIRNIKTINIRNKHATTSVDVTVQFDQNSTLYELIKATLKAGETLEYVEGVGWFIVASTVVGLTNKSVAAQGAGFSSDTYLTGSNVPCVNPTVGTRYQLEFDAAKTGAGTATPIIAIRVGTAATTSDTARVTFTFNASTANADVGHFHVDCMFRTVGSGTSAVLQGRASVVKGLTATTGIVNTVGQALQVTSGGFDSTVASTQIGASLNAGTSAAWTVQLVNARLEQF